MINNNHGIVNVTVIAGADVLPPVDVMRQEFLRMVSESFSDDKEIDFVGTKICTDQKLYEEFVKMVNASTEVEIIKEFITKSICDIMSSQLTVSEVEVPLVTPIEVTLPKDIIMNTAAQASQVATETPVVTEVPVTTASVTETTTTTVVKAEKVFFSATVANVAKTIGIATIGAVITGGGLWMYNRFVK